MARLILVLPTSIAALFLLHSSTAFVGNKIHTVVRTRLHAGTGDSRHVGEDILQAKRVAWPRTALSVLIGAATVAAASVHGVSPALAAPDGSLTEPQHLVAEAWRAVDKRFVDRTFNGHADWFKLRQDAVHRTYGTGEAGMEEAYDAVKELLLKLDDPFTRFLPPSKFESLVNAATATVGGVGVEILEDADGALRVGDVQPLSPAAAAGVRKGDTFVLVDGKPVSKGAAPGAGSGGSLAVDDIAALLRGPPGTSVGFTVTRGDSTVDSTALGPERDKSGEGQTPQTQVLDSKILDSKILDSKILDYKILDYKLTRASFKIETVTSRTIDTAQATAQPPPGLAQRDRQKEASSTSSTSSPPLQPKSYGVVRIKGFSLTTSEDVKAQVQSLLTEKRVPPSLPPHPPHLGQAGDQKAGGADFTIVLDLRNNGGGLLEGGIDTARLFLPQGATVVSTVDLKGVVLTSTVDRPPPFPDVPLIVLVNRKTASAAEVLTAALQENSGRALVVGERTFGKGIVQNVAGLRQGSCGVAVTVATYATPSGHSINKVGIAPDRPVVCSALEDAEGCLKRGSTP